MSPAFPRSPYDTLNGLVYFPRMLHKIRLRAANTLPECYFEQLGQAFDGRCLKFLSVKYEALKERVLSGGTDEEVLEWCFGEGRKPSEEEIEIWSDFMRKRGWRDSSRDRIDFRLKEAGLEAYAAKAVTMFDFIDIDEGRTPPDFGAWEPARTSA